MKRHVLVKLVIVLLTVSIFAYFARCIVRFPVGVESISIFNVESSKCEISFDVLQRDSGYFLSDYDYKVDGSSLILQFWGTQFSLLSAKIPASRITIHVDGPISSIYLESKNITRCVWSYETHSEES